MSLSLPKDRRIDLFNGRDRVTRIGRDIADRLPVRSISGSLATFQADRGVKGAKVGE